MEESKSSIDRYLVPPFLLHPTPFISFSLFSDSTMSNKDYRLFVEPIREFVTVYVTMRNVFRLHITLCIERLLPSLRKVYIYVCISN